MVKVNGFELVCPVCRGKSFSKRISLLNTRGATFLGIEWANQSAINYVCESCGYIFWFIDKGQASPEDEAQTGANNQITDFDTSKPKADECPVCFSRHSKGQLECKNCGHVFK